MNADSSQNQSKMATRVRNFLIAIAAITLSVAIFLGLQTQAPATSLTQMAEESVPLEVALSNGKPTLVEFYANWCTSCQAMAADLGELKQTYAEPLNFVMLNVDNTKWLPEMTRYRVDGIPHFVFLDNQGETVAQTIGEQPKSVMAANLDALIAGLPLPHAQTTGVASSVSPTRSPLQASQVEPRSHGTPIE
ncbi:MAG: thioredoxin domain-containing protein [Desertifilum sp.]|nr:thioredoxin domain-containing protein [Desertifilum sp.]